MLFAEIRLSNHVMAGDMNHFTALRSSCTVYALPTFLLKISHLLSYSKMVYVHLDWFVYKDIDMFTVVYVCHF